MRRSEVGQDAAPADVSRKHGLRRPGVTVRGHYGASAFNGWTRTGERRRKPPGWTRGRGANRRLSVAWARKYGPSDRKAAVERRKAFPRPAVPVRGHCNGASFGAPPPLFFEGAT